jgi:acetyl-CoA C-acetyltransferase
MDHNRIPVLIGCGQITQREADPKVALGPMDLTAAAARKAAEDAGAGDALLTALDSIVVIRSFSDTSWRFASPFGGPSNPPKSIANRIGNNRAKRHIYTHPGGNMPQWCINRLGEMVTVGDVDAALICGGEALATQRNATREQIDLDWNEDADGKPEQWGVATRGWNDNEERHRMAGAIFAYPLFENAIRDHRNRTVGDHLTGMGNLFSGFSEVASRNPLADRRVAYSAKQIAALGPDNPFIGFPYTKLMNANAFIDQSAAVILASVAKARELGISEDRWVYLHGCADAYDHWYISDRHNFHSSPAMRAVAVEALEMAHTDISAIDKFDLYSCFPSSVEIACQEMGIAEDDPRGLTVTGGLPYFGGPGNNYVTHSIAEMMNEVRKAPGSRGMITANGNYVTKQSVGIYSTEPTEIAFAPKDPAVYQQAINDHKGPKVAEVAEGPAHVETYTVMHDRDGPSYAIMFGRLEDGRRFIANTPEDPVLLQNMVDEEFLDVQGQVTNREGQNIFMPN